MIELSDRGLDLAFSFHTSGRAGKKRTAISAFSLAVEFRLSVSLYMEKL